MRAMVNHSGFENPALDRLACELRAAVLGSDHAKATLLTVEFGAAMRGHWTNLSREEREASQLPKISFELLSWVREMTLMQHEMAAQHLAMVRDAGRAVAARATYLETAALDQVR